MKRGQNEETHAASFIKSITCLTGIAESKLKKYASQNNLFNILEHPNAIGANQQQLEKIKILNEFITTYHILKLQENEKKIVINSYKVAGEYFTALLGGTKDKEKFMAAFLDKGNHIIETRIFSEGSVEDAIIYPREILKAALYCDCKNLIVAHNHPGGSLDPSNQDKDITERLISIFSPLHISLLDHIIVANAKYRSMAEQGTLPSSPRNASYEAIYLSGKKEVKEDEAEYGEGVSDMEEIDLDGLDFPEDGWER